MEREDFDASLHGLVCGLQREGCEEKLEEGFVRIPSEALGEECSCLL